MKKSVTFLMVAIMITGCGSYSVKPATEEEDIAAKKFITYPEKATVYIYRDNTHGTGEHVLPSKRSLPVWVDGKNMGVMPLHTYQHLMLEPGEHAFASEGKNRDETVIHTRAGEVTFVQIEAELDVLTRSEVSVFKTDKDIFRKRMKDFFLIKYIGDEKQ